MKAYLTIPSARADGGTARRVCRKCGIEKALDQFNKLRKIDSGRRATCNVCTYARQKQWRDDNPDKARATYKRWRQRHPDIVAAQPSTTQRRRANPEHFREIERAQYARNAAKKAAQAQARRDRDRASYNAMVCKRRTANPDIMRAIHNNRRARVQLGGGTVTRADIRRQLSAQGSRCYYCWNDVSDYYEVDHFQSLASGGLHNPTNIVIACERCNARKNKFDAFTLYRKLGIEVEKLHA